MSSTNWLRLYLDIERNGLHYEIWDNSTGKTTYYQDVCDGGIRLINGYRRYFEIYDAHEPDTPWGLVDNAWVRMPRHVTMPHFNHLLCEKAYYPPNKAALKSEVLSDCDTYYNWDTDKDEHIYPLVLDGCILSFMPIAAGIDINTVQLKKKLCLIKSGDEYHIWGHKDNTLQLTPIESSKIPSRWPEEQWTHGRSELISSKHEFFNTLKEGVSLEVPGVGFSVGLYKGDGAVAHWRGARRVPMLLIWRESARLWR